MNFRHFRLSSLKLKGWDKVRGNGTQVQLASNNSGVCDVKHCSHHPPAQACSAWNFSATSSFWSPGDVLWCCPENPAPAQICSICRALHRLSRQKEMPPSHMTQWNPHLSPESSSMQRFPAIPVLNIQACPLVQEHFSCMQITIGCSYMQLGDKEQSMSHLQGPQMVSYTEFQRIFLANVWA